jgi:phenylalanyl-tRNA synthetase beta chain
LFQKSYKKRDEILIPFNFEKINKILGTNIRKNDCFSYLNKLGFLITNDVIHVPSYRNDINSLNDISEEIARAVGYNNIKSRKVRINVEKETRTNSNVKKLKKLLINHGFYEVINNPFVSEGSNESIQVDNPLDSNKNYL